MNAASDMIAIAKNALRDMRHVADVNQYRDMMNTLRYVALHAGADRDTIDAYSTILAECDTRLQEIELAQSLIAWG